MNTTIFHLIDGAKRAEGLTVIIDVFRAFSMECWLYDLGAKEIRPTGSIEDTFSWRKKDPDCILAGERQGKKIEGCDLGNSLPPLTRKSSGENGSFIRPAPAPRASSTPYTPTKSSPAAL